MQKEEQLKEVIKKSELTAKNLYDYKRLCFYHPNFLTCDVEEEKESLIFNYNIKHLKPFTDIRIEDKMTQLAILIGVSKLFDTAMEYSFSLEPGNLYYDVNGNVYVKNRDIHEIGTTCQEENFVAGYKALIGYSLQKRFGFGDYFEGGMQLLNKTEKLKPFYELTAVEELKALLNKMFDEESHLNKYDRIQVGKRKYRNLRFLLILSVVLMLAASFISGYQYIKVIPEKNVLINADNAFLESDYIRVIDTLKSFPVELLPGNQKYMLAVSYVKSENLSSYQKDNILSEMTLHSDQSLWDYWIYLGRFDVLEAQNIAMQKSNDELLLYAYLKERNMVETDTKISGEEKIQRLKDLESKIEPLSEKYMSEDE